MIIFFGFFPEYVWLHYAAEINLTKMILVYIYLPITTYPYLDQGQKYVEDQYIGNMPRTACGSHIFLS